MFCRTVPFVSSPLCSFYNWITKLLCFGWGFLKHPRMLQLSHYSILKNYWRRHPSLCTYAFSMWQYEKNYILMLKYCIPRECLYCCLNCLPTHLSFLWSFSLFNKKQLPLFKGYLKYSFIAILQYPITQRKYFIRSKLQTTFSFWKIVARRSACCQNYTTFIITQQYYSTEKATAIRIFLSC